MYLTAGTYLTVILYARLCTEARLEVLCTVVGPWTRVHYLDNRAVISLVKEEEEVDVVTKLPSHLWPKCCHTPFQMMSPEAVKIRGLCAATAEAGTRTFHNKQN